MAKRTVLVGMSGGVDSSVAAALLVKRGFDVTGGFIKNWSDREDAWTGECAWRGERRDALRVCAKLGIPLLTFDFEKAYRAFVADEMVRGYARGVTPNPDVLCNEVVKFGLFADEAQKRGFASIATGHYARIRRRLFGGVRLLKGADPHKDQSYF
ncbi:tRNA 2-thiouridine(34) synthase MnmA, partial [Candidatus Uhrbacteria bacterium]|nr:tRNA 2-thiouridine(34) synthase MnmA [Candidatus Uhrbacteria bacterium]